MTGEKTWCNECGRIKEKANHWHRIGTAQWADGESWVEIGYLLGPTDRTASVYEVHDLCGEQCFYKHLAKILKLNPVAEGEQQ